MNLEDQTKPQGAKSIPIANILLAIVTGGREPNGVFRVASFFPLVCSWSFYDIKDLRDKPMDLRCAHGSDRFPSKS